jgi:hypothetical protein
MTPSILTIPSLLDELVAIYTLCVRGISGLYGLLVVNISEESRLLRSYHVGPDDLYLICRYVLMS